MCQQMQGNRSATKSRLVYKGGIHVYTLRIVSKGTTSDPQNVGGSARLDPVTL
jgi:hypothetical protein